MNKAIIGIISFIGGGIAGFFAGAKALEKKYDKIIDEEIASVKEAFRNYQAGRESAPGQDIPRADAPEAEPESDIPRAGARQARDYKACYRKKGDAPSPKIRVIHPNAYGAGDYDMVTLKRYSDGVIVNTDDEIATGEWVEKTLTRQALSRMGEYEPDAVYIRNDDTKTDYEIIAAEEAYYDEP